MKTRFGRMKTRFRRMKTRFRRITLLEKKYQINKSFISVKIKTELLNLSFKPVSFADVFVFSEDFEAIHIRNSSVSRGGIRWSDRADDYRTEVFGLAKTQLAKNSIILIQNIEMTPFEFILFL